MKKKEEEERKGKEIRGEKRSSVGKVGDTLRDNGDEGVNFKKKINLDIKIMNGTGSAEESVS